MWSHAPRPPPQMVWEAALLPPPVVWALVRLIGNPPPSFPPCGAGSGGWESPLWGLVGSTPCWEVLVGSNPWSFQSGGLLVVVQLFSCDKPCGRRFCSETLGCPFMCFGRPWRFLSGTIQYRAIESVLMTSRPPTIYYTVCYKLYRIYSRVYTI